jgi:hypothetical protein
MIQSNSSKRLPTFSSSDASGKAYELELVYCPFGCPDTPRVFEHVVVTAAIIVGFLFGSYLLHVLPSQTSMLMASLPCSCSLEQRAQAESLHSAICHRVLAYARNESQMPAELNALSEAMASV